MLEKYNEITGRKFEQEEDAFKHLENLQKLAFAKQEDIKKEARTELEVEFRANESVKIKEAEDKVKSEFEPFKKFIEEAGIDMTKVNPLAIKEYVGESHEDIKPRTEQVDTTSQSKALEDKIRNGLANQEERNQYMRLTVLKKA